MSDYRFNVFGMCVSILATDTGWETFIIGSEGKRRPAEFIVPDSISAEELAQYLGDLFHENATARNNSVMPIE